MTNMEIATLLRYVAAAFIIKDEQKHHFQIIAYQRAADSIQNTTKQITDLVKEGKLDEISGIGEALKKHLHELVTTGKVMHFETVMRNIPPTVFPLLAVPGFGPKRAYALVKKFGLTNPKTAVVDIESLAKSGKIARIVGFGEKSQDLILSHVKEFKKGSGKTTRMLLPFATEIAEQLIAYLKKCPDAKEVYALGSLRRKLSTVGDVDIAVASSNPESVIEHFVKYPYTERIIEKGPTTSSLLTSGGHQVDVMVQPIERFGSLLQHFTGSKQHNVHVRDYALKKGLSLSEYGMKHLKTNDHKQTTYKTEESFYKAIGLSYIPPELREDTGEIEAAIDNTLPKLVELQDIKGDLHVHSSYPIEPSHDLGASTMQKMLDVAKNIGYEYLGFSEHNPSIAKHTKKQTLDILKKRAEYIEYIKKSNKSIRIFNLLEIDILANGNLAIDDDSLATLDGAIVSIHSGFDASVSQMTKRVLQGLTHPKTKIFAHPTGRLMNQREGYQLDWDAIFSFCKEHNKALEINAWPERTDLPDTLIREAIRHGVRMIISTDSHASTHLGYMQYGVWNARRGWAEKKDILNTMGYTDFQKWLQY